MVALKRGAQTLGRLRSLRRAGGHGETLLRPGQSGPFAESFRLLALNVRRLMDTRQATTLAILSAFPGDGRSIVAANLAIAASEYGRVLLAEVRPDKSRDQGWLHGAITNGSHTNGGAARHGSPDPLPGPFLDTGHPQVWFMDPQERVITSDGLNERILAAGRYGLITVIDSPPATVSSDAYRLAEQAGNVLYVIRAKPQDMAVHNEVRDTLNRLGAEIIGLVVNDF
jgi:hypothetical protein